MQDGEPPRPFVIRHVPAITLARQKLLLSSLHTG
jgi:hypothetical protein